MRRALRRTVLLGTATAILIGSAGATLAAPTVDGPIARGSGGRGLAASPEPVVLRGAQVPPVQRWTPARVVAFRWVNGGWRQVPVQVDERAKVSFRLLYGGRTTAGGYAIGDFSAYVYTDENTHAGSDPVPRIDRNDEIVFMASDTGVVAPTDAARPVGTVGTRVHLQVEDPNSGRVGHVYLFRQDGSLRQDAGRPYVHYDHELLSGDYFSTYRFDDGPNPEVSTVSATTYRLEFGDRWSHHRLNLLTGGPRTDILERHTFMFVPGVCGRSEDTFREAEGALVANISGPVRAIRSYIGANSGPLTQRDMVMYGTRYDVRTYLRVHAIPGGIDAYDYTSAAIGMEYRTNLDPDGVTIDGVPETTPSGRLRWEQVSGAAGTITMVHTLDTNAEVTRGAYRLDDSTPYGTGENQCTGDNQAIGLSGPSLGAIPNTDPTQPGARSLASQRIVYVDGSTASPTTARQHQRHVLNPVTATVVEE